MVLFLALPYVAIILRKNGYSDHFSSTVLWKTVQKSWQIQEEGHFVLFITMSMEQSAGFMVAQIIKLEIHRPANSIKVYGLDILQITPIRICLDLEGHCIDHLK